VWLTHRVEGYCYRKQECTDQFPRLWSCAVEFENWPFFSNPLPIVVTLHDVNQFSAENMVEYLQILVEESRQAGFVITEKPFYDRTEDLQHALNVWWEFNEALRLDCNKITYPPIGTYLPNRRPGEVTKADGPSLVQ
jgi:hypothetical protein